MLVGESENQESTVQVGRECPLEGDAIYWKDQNNIAIKLRKYHEMHWVITEKQV